MSPGASPGHESRSSVVCMPRVLRTYPEVDPSHEVGILPIHPRLVYALWAEKSAGNKSYGGHFRFLAWANFSSQAVVLAETLVLERKPTSARYQQKTMR